MSIRPAAPPPSRHAPSRRGVASRLALVLAVGAFVAAIASPDAPKPGRTKQRIDLLLGRRLHPQALPIELPNPFTAASGGLALPAETKKPDEPAAAGRPPTNGEILARTVATLKIGGVIRLKDQTQIIINELPRREGEFFFVEAGGGTIYLRVVRIAPGQVTIGYQDAEQTLKF